MLSAEQYRDALLTLSGSLAIELPGGRIIVAYYADRITQDQRYHMGAINLSIGELR